jgi:carbonic anhydrase/acetyltransferase-like protein (isoleucine patch superfamily)
MPSQRSDGPAAGPPTRQPLRLLPNRLDIHRGAWVAPGAVVVGDVALADEVSIWYGCVLRGDLEPIRVGRATNIQDLTLIHVDHDLPAIIGERVTVAHRCVIHGCTIGDGALIGMGAVVLSGARVGNGALVAAGAVVREGFEVPPDSIVAGVPAEVVGEVGDRLRARMKGGILDYLDSARGYRSGRLGGGPHGGEPAGRREEDPQS